MVTMKRLVVMLGMDVPKSFGEENFWTDCPCHKDEDATLHVYRGVNGRIVMHCCVCGARTKDVCKEIGVPAGDLEVKRVIKPPITVDWNAALDVAACAVIDKITELTGNKQVASEQLIDALTDSFADRLGSMVWNKINSEIEASTPPADKTDSAVGFERRETNG